MYVSFITVINFNVQHAVIRLNELRRFANKPASKEGSPVSALSCKGPDNNTINVSKKLHIVF